MEYGRIYIASGSERWYRDYVGKEMLARLEFSIINGRVIMYCAKLIQVPVKYQNLIVQPKDFLLC